MVNGFEKGAMELAKQYSIESEYFKSRLPIKGDEPIIFLWSSQFNNYCDESNFFTGVEVIHDSGENPEIIDILEDSMFAYQYVMFPLVDGSCDGVYYIAPNSDKVTELKGYYDVLDIDPGEYGEIINEVKEKIKC